MPVNETLKLRNKIILITLHLSVSSFPIQFPWSPLDFTFILNVNLLLPCLKSFYSNVHILIMKYYFILFLLSSVTLLKTPWDSSLLGSRQDISDLISSRVRVWGEESRLSVLFETGNHKATGTNFILSIKSFQPVWQDGL